MVNLRNNIVSSTDAPMIIILPFLLFSLLQLLFTLPVDSYNPVDDFAVNCGFSGNTTSDTRIWVGDVDPKRFSTIEPRTGKSSLIADAPSHFFYNGVPYGTARLFLSEFTYSFPVTTGPKFLRLHFYPTSYANFEPYNSLFSVKAGNFTLLKDFNASRWLVDVDDETVSKEYCINVDTGDETLNVTFLPSTSHPNAYAFINGIEVVSMPSFLYYSDPDDRGFELVGHDVDTYRIENNTALETLYRIKVGQRQIPPSLDTGMFRDWETDAPYLKEEHSQSISVSFLELNYKNNGTPDYTAPAEVYLSGRSYGMHATANYNVTWEFQVDSAFTYMIRLHFCEYDIKVQHYGDRSFQIFIADQLAEPYADIIGWSGGNLIPVHRDYAVLMLNQEGQSSTKVNVSIKLQRLPNEKLTNYHDVLLNGVEIFKISDNHNNLAGSNPVPSPSQVLHPTQSSKTTKKKTIVIIAVVAVSGFALMLASVIGIIAFRRRRRGHDVDDNSWKTKSIKGSSLPSHLCRYFTIAEIRAATNNFDDVFIIGVGGFGNVYKGYIDGATPVAIKRLKQGSQQGANEFLNEIEMLSQLRHLHLVSLIGYCNDGVEMILVYDFMQRGTLREYLYGGSDIQPLPWKPRLEILLGAARGLHYLHAGAKHNIIHRDVKSTNILLDEKWVAKVSDFGLSKVGPTGMSKTHISTIVKGSLGYLDPEYYKRQRLTLKSDVYSFGVVLLEVLCGRPPLIRSLGKEKVSLVDWVKRCHDRGELDQTVDPFIKDSITSECLKFYGQMALSCLLDDGNERPSMSDVVGALEFAIALQLAENEDDNRCGRTKDDERPLIGQFMSNEEGSDVRFTSSDESGTQSSKVTSISASSEEKVSDFAVVFSEIGDPRPR